MDEDVILGEFLILNKYNVNRFLNCFRILTALICFGFKVTFNYRLNSLGFLNTGDGAIRGNQVLQLHILI